MGALVIKTIACAFAGLSGFFITLWWNSRVVFLAKQQRARKGYQVFSEPLMESLASGGVPARILRFMEMRTRITTLRPQKSFFTQRIWLLGLAGFEKVIPKTGLSNSINKKGFLDTRARFCLTGCFSGVLVGVVFSEELALVLALVFTLIGWRLPLWALKQERDARKTDLENHLSEMLEVVSLGLRSGLSFDRSFELYHFHFTNTFGIGSASAQQLWQLGLATREVALRRFCATYDSAMFARVVENIVRSLRFGASLADSLEASALESRAAHKAFLEEKVAKAPVKMLIPTAALILPAMLMLVLGPVLLEMLSM